MKAAAVHITHFEFIALKEFRLVRETGEHGRAVISGHISDENLEAYQQKLLQELWVTISAEVEDDRKVTLMTGVVAGFSLDSKPHLHTLTLTIMSGTYQMDGRPHFRTFQNQTLSYLDIFNQMNEGYPHSGTIGEEKTDASVGSLLVQYQETDWDFVKRLAARLGLCITPAIEREGVIYYVGEKQHQTHTLPSDVYCNLKKNVGDFMQQSANGTGPLQEQGYLEYEVCVRDIFNLWDHVRFDSREGCIYKITSEYVHEELIHTYSMRLPGQIRAVPVFNWLQTGCSFPAVVKGVKADRVQIDVIGDENSSQEINLWFPFATPYSSPDGPGWYCMPETGDQVRLHIPCEREEEGYVVSSVHLETGTDRKNPDHKSLKTKYGKELLFTPDSIHLTNNKGMKIEILDNEGIRIVSDKNIVIQSSENMTLSSEESSLMIAGTSSVDVKQGNTGVHLDDNIEFTGGKFRIQ